MSTTTTYRKDTKINWYRSKIDKQLLNELMQTSDVQGWRQVLLQLGLYALTGALSYLAYRNISASNWPWSVPLLLVALFFHGTFSSFIAYVGGHELCHKTPFRNKAVNEFVLKVYAFISWFDYIWFRQSHIKHHQATVHHDYDGEVVLPQKLGFQFFRFWLALLAWDPINTKNLLKSFVRRSMGRLDNDWYRYVLPETNVEQRRQHRNWARFVLFGHIVLAALFIVTGHWFLIVVFTLGTQYSGWLLFLCGVPQHYGLTPDVTDFRLCCRTYTCSRFIGFLYWNMQYHIEHHMFPAVPFFNLPKLRAAIEHDLPSAPHGLRATWRELLAIHRKTISDPTYCYRPPLPSDNGDQAEDAQLEREAALTV